jgi:hypothetical protein
MFHSIIAGVVALVVTTSVVLTLQPPPGPRMFLPVVNVLPPPTPTPVPTPVPTPIPTPVPAPTEIVVQRPTPYDVDAQNIALGVGDVSPGFYLDEAGAIEPSDYLLSLGFVSGYETILINEDLILKDAFLAASLVYVFMESGGAQLQYNGIATILGQDPDYQQVSVSRYGDETSAFVVRDVIEGFAVEFFFVVTRLGNVNIISSASGLASVTEVGDATKYTQRMLQKIQTARVSSASVSGSPAMRSSNSGTNAQELIIDWMERARSFMELNTEQQ